jgi:hypothetical protein
MGAFRSLNAGVNYKVGQSLCKSRLCPNCQRVLSAKRKNNFIEWYDRNSEALAPFYRYHFVLTLKHSAAEALRTNVYTAELLQYFAELRGTSSGNQRKMALRKKWWNDRVAGGTYSVEIKKGRDGSPHIHLHCMLLAYRPLWRSDKDSVFLKGVRKSWSVITKDSDNVFIEPVYVLDESGAKVYAPKGSSDTAIKAVAECMKYTLKADADSLAGYSTEFLTELITFRTRYYGRFGILSKRSKGSERFVELDRLNTDFKDLESIKHQEFLMLFDPETGEMCPPEAVLLAVTHFTNTLPKKAAERAVGPQRMERGAGELGGQKYYAFKDASIVSWYEADQKKNVAKHLSKSLYHCYKSENDTANTFQTN